MNKGTKIAFGFIGLGLLYLGFTKKYDTTDANTGTENLLDTIDKNILFSRTQTETLARQIKEQGGKPLSHIQVRTWKGMVQLDIEQQETDKQTLTYAKMQQISYRLDNLFASVLSTGTRAISEFCNINKYVVSERISTIETNLVNLSKIL